jgi:hypothetical protein
MGPHPSSHFDSYRPKFSVRCSCAPENRVLDISHSGWFATFETSLSGEFFTVVDQPKFLSLMFHCCRFFLGSAYMTWLAEIARNDPSKIAEWAAATWTELIKWQWFMIGTWSMTPGNPWEPLGYQDTTKVGPVGVVNTVYSRYDLVLWYRL